MKEIPRERAQRMLREHAWSKDVELSSILAEDVYVDHADRALIFAANGNSVLYDTREELARVLAPTPQPTHLLDGRMEYGADFADHVPKLVETLPTIFGLERGLAAREESLKIIDSAVKSYGYKNSLKREAFSSLVAFVGEVLRVSTDGRWSVRRAGNVWEPWIIGADGRSHPPFAIVYKELRLGGRGSIAGAVNGQLRASRLG